MYNYHILAVDDNVALLESLKLILKNYFSKVGIISSPNIVKAVLNGGDVDAVLLDMNFNNGKFDCSDGFFWLDIIKNVSNPPIVILMTAFGDIEIAVRAMKNGADDFVTKPWDNDELIKKLLDALKKRDESNRKHLDTKLEEKVADGSILETMEREKLKEVLRETNRNITKAAIKLGISRRTLYNKISKYGI